MKRTKLTLMAIAALGALLGASGAWAQQTAMESTSAKKHSVNVKPVHNQNFDGADWRATTNATVNPDEYVVGEADTLHVNVWKEPELSQTVVVRPDGKISLPLVNEMKVSGMTPSQIQQLMTDRLKAYLVAPQVTVTVTDIRSKTVYITGEVLRAGEYPLLTPVTVLQLIARAGGLTTYASRKGIFVLRDMDGKQVRYSFDYNDVIRAKNASQNIELKPGDTVVVP
jgi:polysaccharide export outer membrane protein